ncbi:MAG: ABC-2 type transport system ATP-binding protein [Glaciecola sp.]|jgi:ABC-2 type transport system ATP-binding protein
MSGQQIVEVNGVRKRFGDVQALDGVTLSIAAGEVYGLLGANGAGKTTLINVLATLLRPDEGTARVAGLDVATHAKDVRRRIGLAGQFAAVDDYLTGRETVEMVGRLYGLSQRDARTRAADVLEGFGLSDAGNRQSKTYSGGMRRRLDLAASLVGHPDILFLDEPTTGIDPVSRIDIWGFVRDLVAQGTTVLLTTQYLEEADELANRIGVIDKGRLVSEGTPDELKDALGDSAIHLHVRDEDAEMVRTLLATVNDVIEQANGQFVIPAVGGNAMMMSMLRSLDGEGVEPLHLALERPTLDDVFLRIIRSSPETSTEHQEAAR